MRIHSATSALAALCGLAVTAPAQDLLIPESSNDVVMLVSGFDGSLINATFLDLSTATPAPSLPIESIVVGNEIWTSDQVADTVFRYSLDGTTFLGTATTGRDNMRGIGLANGAVYATNSGTGGAGYGDVCKEYDLTGSLVNQFSVGDPFDVIDFGGTLLIADIAADVIQQHAYDGTPLGQWSAVTTVMAFPEQISLRSNGNVLVATFSSPSGIFEFDSTGAEVAFYSTPPQGGLRGVKELGNGLYLFTNGAGVHTLDPVSGTVTTVIPGISARFISEAPGGSPTTPFCTAKTGLVCGTPSISAAGTPSATATSGFTVSAGPARSNKSGILLYSSAPIVGGAPFQGGTLCVETMGLRRAGSTNSGGTGCPGPATCDGQFDIDMNAFAQSLWVVPDCAGAPAGTPANNAAGYLTTPGVVVSCQYWGRDSVASGSFVSDGLSYTITP